MGEGVRGVVDLGQYWCFHLVSWTGGGGGKGMEGAGSG